MNNATQIAETQVLRGNVLKISCNAEPLGAGTEIILAELKKHRYAVDKDDVEKICVYLEGKGLLRVENVKNEVLNIHRNIAHITPKGIDVLEGTESVSGIVIGG